MDNAQRAAAARVALEAFVPQVAFGQPLDAFPNEHADYAKDLIINLLHFLRLECGMSGPEVDAATISIRINYDAEVLEEEGGDGDDEDTPES